jgi:membrane-bound lytic murein transglycosylase D
VKIAQRPWFVLLPLLLAACATASLPSARVHPSRARTTEAAVLALPIARSAPAIEQSPLPASTDVWERLRDSFAMEGCGADPRVISWAQRYTRDPQRFEARMKAALPRLVYVQESAARHGVAGEFALLPWVESHYRPAATVRANRPAGIWQIMPVTAGAMGLRVNRTYDGRLDLAASTEGVMRLLHRYHARYGDWTLADYAYNAGESAMRRRSAPSAKTPKAVRATGPDATAREHLVKLQAIACVVREPTRFHVTLPVLMAGQRLVAVTVDRSMPLAQAAVHAGMSIAALEDLNAAFRDGVLDTRYADHLLLPKSHATQFRAAMQSSADAGAAGAASHPQVQAQLALASTATRVSIPSAAAVPITHARDATSRRY